MDSNRTYSKEEISKILALASKIQNRKDVTRDEQVLTVDDLRHIAEEVGIDQESLNQAIDKAGSSKRDATFRWFRQSSTILDDLTLTGEITDEVWEDVVQEIRHITGHIGKISKVGKTFEWEQSESDTGVEKHVSMSQQNGNTKIRFIAQWKASEIIMSGFAMFVGAGLGMFLFNFFQLTGATFFTLPLLGGVAGFGLARVFFKRYFKKQKMQFAQITAAVEKRLRQFGTKKIMLDEVELDLDATSETQRALRERS